MLIKGKTGQILSPWKPIMILHFQNLLCSRFLCKILKKNTQHIGNKLFCTYHVLVKPRVVLCSLMWCVWSLSRPALRISTLVTASLNRSVQWLLPLVIMNREELEEVFNRVYVGQYKKNEKRKVDGSKTLDRNYFSRFRRVSDFCFQWNILKTFGHN